MSFHSRTCIDCAQRRRGFLSRLPPGMRDDVACVLRPRSLTPGTVLVEGGRPSLIVHAVQEGMAKVEAEGPHGHTRIVDLLGPGSLAGLEAVFDRPAPFTVRAVTPMVTCQAPAGDFRQLLQREGVAGGLADHLLCVLERAGDRLRGLGANTAVERLAAFLVDGPLPIEGPGRLRLPLKRREIAALLGITPETVARSLHALTEEGLIVVNGDRVTILEEEQLILRADGENPASGG